MHSTPVVKFTNLLLLAAFREGAESITLEPDGEVFRVTYTVDGNVQDGGTPDLEVGRAVCDRLWLCSRDGRRVSINYHTGEGVQRSRTIEPVRKGENMIVAVGPEEEALPAADAE